MWAQAFFFLICSKWNFMKFGIADNNLMKTTKTYNRHSRTSIKNNLTYYPVTQKRRKWQYVGWTIDSINGPCSRNLLSTSTLTTTTSRYQMAWWLNEKACMLSWFSKYSMTDAVRRQHEFPQSHLLEELSTDVTADTSYIFFI